MPSANAVEAVRLADLAIAEAHVHLRVLQCVTLLQATLATSQIKHPFYFIFTLILVVSSAAILRNVFFRDIGVRSFFAIAKL